MRAVNDALQQAREELDEEFRQFRGNIDTIHRALRELEEAGPLDDVSELLERLEDTVEEVRTGGAIGGGAKGHAKARKRYLELQGERS